MRFEETCLKGAWLITPEPIEDDRGFFARTYCEQEFAAHGLATQWVQSSISFSVHAHTLRGMHYQIAPHQEDKLIRCTRGALLDVIIDLRQDSPTRLQHFAVELNPNNRLMVYAPKGFAHGSLTLEPETEVFYQMSAPFEPAAARGVRWNDPAFSISWPALPEVICERDANYEDFQP